MEDVDIIKLFFNRDEEAIKETSKKYGARLKKVSYEITEDMQITEECENDTYLEAWNNIPPNEPTTYFYAYLIRIIRNLSLDQYRKQHAKKRYGDIVELSEELENCIASYNDVEEKLDAKILGETINLFLSKIALEKRIIFIRRYFYCDSIFQISKRMNMSESKIKTIIFRLRKELKKYLEKEGYMNE